MYIILSVAAILLEMPFLLLLASATTYIVSMNAPLPLSDRVCFDHPQVQLHVSWVRSSIDPCTLWDGDLYFSGHVRKW